MSKLIGSLAVNMSVSTGRFVDALKGAKGAICGDRSRRPRQLRLTPKGRNLVADLRAGAELGEDADGNLIAIWPEKKAP